MTIHKQEVVKKPKRGMSRARRAHLSRLAKMRWAAKRQADFDTAKKVATGNGVEAKPEVAHINTIAQRLVEAKVSVINAMAQVMTSAAGLADNLHGI